MVELKSSRGSLVTTPGTLINTEVLRILKLGGFGGVAIDIFILTPRIMLPARTILNTGEQTRRVKKIDFFKNSFLGHDYGDQKLSFCVKNPEDNSVIELVSMQHRIKINDELLSIIHDVNNYEVFLN